MHGINQGYLHLALGHPNGPQIALRLGFGISVEPRCAWNSPKQKSAYAIAQEEEGDVLIGIVLKFQNVLEYSPSIQTATHLR